MDKRNYNTHPITDEEQEQIYALKEAAEKQALRDERNKPSIKRNKLNSNYTKPKKRRKKR